MTERILIVKLSSMGDVIHTLPAAQALRQRFPDAHLGWVVEDAHSRIIRGQEWLDEVIVWHRHQLRSWPGFARELRASRWTIAIDFQGLLRSAFIARLSGAKQVIGYHPSRELAHLLYNECVPLATMDRHAVDRNLDLVATLDAQFPGLPLIRPYLGGTSETPAPPQLPPFPMPIDNNARSAVDQWLRDSHVSLQQQTLVILNTHARKQANCWPAENFAQLGRRLLDAGYVVALSGSPGTRALNDRIAALAGPGLLRADGCFDLMGLAELLRRSAIMITGDTGPMHVAVAVDCPVVALFGPASPLRTGPYAADAVVLDTYLECAPCFTRSCRLNPEAPPCMQAITVDSVYQTVLERLQGHRVPANLS